MKNTLLTSSNLPISVVNSYENRIVKCIVNILNDFKNISNSNNN